MTQAILPKSVNISTTKTEKLLLSLGQSLSLISFSCRAATTCLGYFQAYLIRVVKFLNSC